MTINELISAINEQSIANGNAGFAGDFASVYDISNSEAERLAAKAATLADFQHMWENDDWWTDANQ